MPEFKFEKMDDKKYRGYYAKKMKLILSDSKYNTESLANYYRCAYALNIPMNEYTDSKYNKNDIKRLSLLKTVITFMDCDNIVSDFYSENKIEQAKKITKFLQILFNIKGNKYINNHLNLSINDYIIKFKNGQTLNISDMFEYDSYTENDARELLLNKYITSKNYIIRNLYDLNHNYTFHKFDSYLLKFDYNETEDLYFRYQNILNRYQLTLECKSKEYKVGLNIYPIDFYNQENITFSFKFGKLNIKSDDVYIYNDFAFEIFCKESGEKKYKSIVSYKEKFNDKYHIPENADFLIIFNTKKGAYIYESNYGETIINDYIIEQSSILNDVVYLKNKNDFFDKYINIVNKSFMLSYYYIGNASIKTLLKSSFANEYADDYNDYYMTDLYNQEGLDLKEIALQINETDIENNLFADDNTLNYHFKVKKSDIKLNSLLSSFSINDSITNSFFSEATMYCGAIYHIPVTKIYDCITTIDIDEKIKNYAKSNVDLFNYLTSLKNVCTKIAIKISEEFNENNVPLFLYERYLKKYEVAKLRKQHNEILNGQQINWDISSANSIVDGYLKEELKKWKSEYTLYLLVSKQFNDAIYQYKAEWLNLQSLDIYIPSLKIGIEYQGIQHFKPIDHFGGENGLKEVKKHDAIKKQLCKENGIKLIYWLYTEPITEVLLKDKIFNYESEEKSDGKE